MRTGRTSESLRNIVIEPDFTDWGRVMTKFYGILLGSVAGLALAGAAQAADIPTKKTPPAPAATNCYASFWDWLNASAADCPLSVAGFTLYGTIDVGGGYETHATKFNRNFANGVQELVSKTSNNGKWQWVPNGLSQSNIGVKMKEQVAPNWYIVGDVNFGFDPYSFELANGPQSLVDNNTVKTLTQQSASGDSSRAGQWDNTRAYIGVSNPTFGTLTFGRQYSLTNDLSGNYDPFGNAYAFSLIGTSGTVEQGTGETETARYNTSVKYQIAYGPARASTIVQVGGWEQGNGAQQAFQVGLGGDYAGFSLDAVYAYDKDAVKLGTFNGSPVYPTAAGHPLSGLALNSDTLKATLADVNAAVIGAKYKWNALTVYSGYEYARLSSPSDFYRYYGTGTFAGDSVIHFNGDYAALVGNDAFGHNNGRAEELQVLWIGAKYGILSNLDGVVGYYYEWQNDFDIKPATNCKVSTNKSDCAGHTDVVSGMLDWRPVKRVDVYGGVMYSEVTGGMASGFTHTNNTAFTSGVRINF